MDLQTIDTYCTWSVRSQVFYITYRHSIARLVIEYGILGEGSQISTNQKRESNIIYSDWLKFGTLPQRYRTQLIGRIPNKVRQVVVTRFEKFARIAQKLG